MRGALDRGGLSLTQTAVASFSASQALDPSADFDYDYVLDCQPLAHGRGLALALSTRNVQLRSRETLGLEREFHAHNDAIHEIWTSATSPQLLASCSSDECVKLWDTRAALPALVVSVGREVWSLAIGCGETLLAAGTDEQALFFDVRTGAQLGQYGDSHVDAVTQVRFHPTRPEFVVTASEDGVVCVFDCRISDEEDALESILNVESAVSTVGFFGPQRENIFCLTGTETLDLWNLWTAERLHHYDTVRDDCNRNGLATDYLIDCVYDDQADELLLLAGNHDGDMNAVSIGTDAASAGKLQHATVLKGAHKACVRCVYYDPQTATLYSGGEDTRLCKWTVPGAAGAATDGSASSSRRATGLDPASIRKARKASRPY